MKKHNKSSTKVDWDDGEEETKNELDYASGGNKLAKSMDHAKRKETKEEELERIEMKAWEQRQFLNLNTIKEEDNES